MSDLPILYRQRFPDNEPWPEGATWMRTFVVPVEVDYEAAAKMVAIRCDGIVPEDWGHHSVGIVERARADAKRVVDAALGVSDE